MTTDEKLDAVLKEITTLRVVLLGENGYKGVAVTVEEHTNAITKINACLEPLNEMPGVVEKLKTTIDNIDKKPGDNALKWFTRIGVALLSAVCIGLFTYLFTIHSITAVQIVDPNTPHSQHVMPSSGQPPTNP